MLSSAGQMIPMAMALAASPSVYPMMDLVKLPQTNGAACLDGTPPAYWYVGGKASTKFYINFEGGGWCTSLDSCYERGYGSGRRKGSSSNLPNPFNLVSLMNAWGNWYFSNQTTDGHGHNLNPVMHDSGTPGPQSWFGARAIKQSVSV